ncbi:uncharacterized protein LOC113239194 [Hyposmocoma kahamanoa]|uniref:uncharacterized protein LOC113239194 n=1 Tax=Hyposmocoma kahamanoa TaxID=1477025 RepID=UPI000E6D6380|nr:uncharacterized protein LOC113239194 [Hyposmocoma kahamanoa]
MDWLKLFALLVAVASVQITADGPKKKIRIHLPQKVKHIHHHKKIYITNHPAPSQYAPAFLTGVKGGVAQPSNFPKPTVTGILPFNSVQLYEDGHPGLPQISPAASKLLPLYRARGRYGPEHQEWEDQEYDVESPREHKDIYAPSGYSAPPQSNAVASVSNHPKRIKYVKVNELPRKKVIRKKPKRVIVRTKQQPHQTPPPPPTEEEHPVSTYHEQFYSDLEEAGTISKIKKPPRIEKIVDGDTEHIHTYSEEHIHKVVFDDDSKVTGIVGVDPDGSMSALSASHPLIPLKNSQTLVAVPSNNFADLAVVGSMGTPSHLEYAAYSPHDVTHDHIFHDHGEIPSNIEVTKETLRLPPKISYNSLGLPISTSKRAPNKHRLYSKPTKPTNDFSYYENLYNTPGLIPKKLQKPTPYTVSSEGDLNEFRPLPSIRFKEGKKKYKNRPYGKQIIPNFQASVPSPFAVSSTVVHEYEPKHYGPAPTGFSKFRDSFSDFKDSYSSDIDYDTYAASSNIHTSEDKNDSAMTYQPKEKKSVSTQNISFGGQDLQTYVDHIGSAIVPTENEEPTALEHLQNSFDFNTDSISPTPYTIRETSPAHPYYTVMALKAFHGGQPEASNNNEIYAAPPETTIAATESAVLNTTTSQPLVHYFKIQSTDAITPEPNLMQKPNKKRREKSPGHRRHRYLLADFRDEQRLAARHPMRHGNKHDYLTDTSGRGNLKYGDKI